MNTDLEARLTESMHHTVDGIALTSDVLGRAKRRHQRRTTTIRIGYALGVTSVAGVLAAGLTLGGGATPRQDAGKAPTVQAQPASLRLASAVEASENVSYKVKVTVGSKDNRGALETMEGAFDPRTDTGFLNSSSPGSGVVSYERLIDGVRFVGSSGSNNKWKQYPGKHDRLAYDGALNGVAGASADPDQLFKALRQAGAAITETGARVYHFTVTLNGGSTGLRSNTLSGDVTLDADKRIAKVTYEQVTQGEKAGQVYTSSSVVSVQLSDYGTPVTVERPTDVVVVD
jgi:hypothetical protein